MSEIEYDSLQTTTSKFIEPLKSGESNDFTDEVDKKEFSFKNRRIAIFV